MLRLPYKVLIVDDMEDVAEVLGIYLEDICGDKIEISTALSAAEARDHIQKDPPNILITDIIMPSGTGDELLRALVQEQRGIHTIVMTGEVTFTNIVNAFRDGAFSIIKKPFSKDEIAKTILACIDNLDEWKTNFDLFRKK